MRLFIAAYPTRRYIEYFRDILRAFSKQKRNLIPIPIDQTHITLKYIGNKVSHESMEIIKEELLNSQYSFTKAEIQIDKLMFGFPFQSYKSVMHVNLVQTPSLKTLANEFHDLTKRLDLSDTIRWKGKYKSYEHITIARLKENASKSTSKLIYSNVKNVKIQIPEPFFVEDVYLVESKLIKGEPKYTKLEKITL